MQLFIKFSSKYYKNFGGEICNNFKEHNVENISGYGNIIKNFTKILVKFLWEMR